MISHNTSLSKFKIKIILAVFSEHSGMKLEINNKRKLGKLTNVRKLNNMLNHQSTSGSKKK